MSKQPYTTASECECAEKVGCRLKFKMAGFTPVREHKKSNFILLIKSTFYNAINRENVSFFFFFLIYD